MTFVIEFLLTNKRNKKYYAFIFVDVWNAFSLQLFLCSKIVIAPYTQQEVNDSWQIWVISDLLTSEPEEDPLTGSPFGFFLNPILILRLWLTDVGSGQDDIKEGTQ